MSFLAIRVGWSTSSRHTQGKLQALLGIVYLNFNLNLNFSNLGGEIFMESMLCSVNIAHLTFHGMMFRELWGKLGMICVAGKPNMAKTKEIMSALHMSSSRQFFYAMKVNNS